MPYRQNAPLSSVATSRYTNSIKADDQDNGGTKPIPGLPAAHQPPLTPAYPLANIQSSRKPPSAFALSGSTNLAASRPRDPPENATTAVQTTTLTSRRRQSSIPNAKPLMGPRLLEHGNNLNGGKRCVVECSFQNPPHPSPSLTNSCFPLLGPPPTPSSTLSVGLLLLLLRIHTPKNYPSTTFPASALHPYSPKPRHTRNVMPAWTLAIFWSPPSILTIFRTPLSGQSRA